MKLGYSTWGMPTVTPEISIPYLADLGFDGIELAVIPGHTTDLATLSPQRRVAIRDLLTRHHLALSAIAAHSTLLAEDPDSHRANVARLHAAIDLAIDWAQEEGPPCIETTTGGKPEDWPALRPRLIERAGQLAEYAARAGVIIAVEPHVGSILDTPERALAVLDAVNSPYFRVNFDISHFNVMGIAVEESVRQLVPYAAHTHVKDERGLYPDFEFLIPGEGDFDYVNYLRVMRQHGYDGYITAEISVMVQRRADYDPLGAAAQTYRVLARAFQEAGIAR